MSTPTEKTEANDAIYANNGVALAIGAVCVGITCIVGWLGGSSSFLAGLPALLALGLLAIVIQWVVFIPSYLARTEHFYDLTGSLTYITVIIAALWIGAEGKPWEPRQLLVAGLVLVWAGRLGSFLFLRVRKAGHDGRFDQIKQSAARFFIAWSIQGLWVFLTALSALIILVNPSGKPLGLIDMIGLTVWLIGFGIEAIADRQKSVFRSDPSMADRWIDSGLWSWSRHPNYFGEITLWTGMTLIGASIYEGTQWVGLITPVFVTWLLTQISGIPLLEARADKKWGTNQDYQVYKANTPVLILRPPRAAH